MHRLSRTSYGFRPTWGRAIAIACGLACATLGATATAVTIAPSATTVGATPEIVGYNSGHFTVGSNTASWWKYAGVNGARVWSTPSVVEAHPSTGSAEDDNAFFGDGVQTQAGFLQRRGDLRAAQLLDPNLTSTTYINWPLVKNNYQNTATSSNNLTLDHAFGTLRSLGIEPTVEMDRTNARYPFNPLPGDPTTPSAAWGERWEQWQHFYMQAFYLAKNYDIHRFQMYNEPNHGSPADVTPEVYLERMQFASDAVQAAVADVNALYGKSLDPQMQGPITAGGTSTYNSWGKPVIQNLQTNFLGQGNIQLIDTYGYQQYNLDGPGFASQLASIKNLVNADAGGTPLRFALTEFSTMTAATFDATEETLDTPAQFSRMGSILTNLANQQPHELYVQKFSQTDGKKNGVHFVDDGNAPYNVGGVTKGGEVVRLFAKGFAGEHELLQTPTGSGTGASDLQMAASYNAEAGRYSLMSSNISTSSSRTLDLNLTDWGIEPGTYVTVEEVSSDRHGEVRQLIEVPANRQISISQSPQSVLLITAPESKPAYRVTLGATDDAMVKAGSNANANFGDSQNLYAKNDPTNSSARNASFIKFDMGGIGASSVEQAVLRVKGLNTGDGTLGHVITHVYGLLGAAGDAWNEETINWNNAPNLGNTPGIGTVNDISQNFIEGIGSTAEIVGHFTGTLSERELMLDVTPFVQEHPDQQITFLIAREVRFDGENVDDAFTSLMLASKERVDDAGPQLILSLNETALPGDFDFSGTVDGADLAEWQTGPLGPGDASDGDADFDGDVDGNDFLVWQRQVGSSILPPPQATPVPEPSSAAILTGLALLTLATRGPWSPVRRSGSPRRRGT